MSPDGVAGAPGVSVSPGPGAEEPLGEGVGEGMFLVWTPGTCGEPMFTSGHLFSISATGVVIRCPKWPISGDTD